MDQVLLLFLPHTYVEVSNHIGYRRFTKRIDECTGSFTILKPKVFLRKYRTLSRPVNARNLITYVEMEEGNTIRIN